MKLSRGEKWCLWGAVVAGLLCGVVATAIPWISVSLHPSVDNDPGIFFMCLPIVFGLPCVVGFGMTWFFATLVRLIAFRH